jgi:hypothetical protein
MDNSELLHLGHSANYEMLSSFQKEELVDKNLNIFEAMIMNRKERVESLINSHDSSECILSLKARDELGRLFFIIAFTFTFISNLFILFFVLKRLNNRNTQPPHLHSSINRY